MKRWRSRPWRALTFLAPAALASAVPLMAALPRHAPQSGSLPANPPGIPYDAPLNPLPHGRGSVLRAANTLPTAHRPPAPARCASHTAGTAIQMGDGPDGFIRDGKPVTKGWKSLFDGRTLAGWMGEKGYWEVKDRAIVGTSPPGTPHHHYLLSTKDYSDFDLHADVKLVGYNSGVCIRIHPETYDSVPGYQVDMGDGYWGCLWDEHHRQRKIFDYPKEKADQILHKDDWNHYFVRAVGHHVTLFLNGVKTADGEDPGGYLSGPLGFQLCHGGNEVASFRNLYVKLLAPATKGTAPPPPAVVIP